VQPRLLAATVVAATALAAPASATAAALGVVNPKPCFGAADIVGLGGAQFTPGATISFARDNAPISGTVVADAAGSFLAPAGVPQIVGKTETSTYAATDGVNTAAAPPVKLSRLGVTIRPARANPNRVRRISARGFTLQGRTLYAHRVRNRRSKNLSIGRLRGDCKTASRRKRVLRGARPGTYRLQFDTFRRYRADRRQRVVFRVRVTRRLIRRSQVATAAGAAAFGLETAGLRSSATSASWERIH
jgi:hypothetical protein